MIPTEGYCLPPWLVACLAGCSDDTVYVACRRGELKCKRIVYPSGKGRWLIDVTSGRRWARTYRLNPPRAWRTGEGDRARITVERREGGRR